MSAAKRHFAPGGSLNRHLVIFAREPRAGAGKRRLAAGVGALIAVRFQRVRLRVLLLRLGRDRRWRTWLAVTPDGSTNWPAGVGLLRQGDGDLGQRMGRVFKALPPGPVVIIGTDIPGVAASDIAAAFRALGSHDAVIGPAGDGGYWLIGLRRRPTVRLPFGGVRWSSQFALQDTQANLAGATVAHLRELGDVDDEAGLAANPRWARVV